MNSNHQEPSSNLVPSDELVYYVGGGDFLAIGKEFLTYFISLGSLQPHESVLDVGSGSGRMAVPLTKYLSENGSYAGFDLYAEGIKWSKENITPKFPNFQFNHIDIYNQYYNPSGQYKATHFKFPYQDQTFDFIFLTSVFTHMLPDDLENYLSEISRVMKKTGRCFITQFLLNPESTQLQLTSPSTLRFIHNKGNYSLLYENQPEFAVAYKESFINSLFHKYHLELYQPVQYGSWCGRKKFLSYQDVIILKKQR
nr:class I SAM-dependent methyltransferase [uncultured Bacillus sp.]